MLVLSLLVLLVGPCISALELATQDVAVRTECSTAAAAGPAVCGSDGVTYPSKTHLACAKNGSVVEVFSGSCDDPCWQAVKPSIQQENPTCGSDGVKYPNPTVLACAIKHTNNLTTATACSDPEKRFDPCLLLAYVTSRKICGSDNVTYNNIWHLRCTANMYDVEDLTLQHEGECNIECPYSPLYDPVCSTDDYLFANEEALKCHQILQPYINSNLQHRGPCARNKNQNPCHVNNAYTPVCASNGRTYGSPDHVLCLRENNPGLQVLHSGPCSVTEVRKLIGESTACTLAADRYEWNPVCASDNRTYGNPYRFFCAAAADKDLRVLYEGECDAFSYCRVPAEPMEPVCGTNGVTYTHLNKLYCAQNGQRHLQLKHKGPCTPADEPCLYRGTPFLENSGTPVCASNNLTYVYPQAVWCAAKQTAGLEIKHDGECF